MKNLIAQADTGVDIGREFWLRTGIGIGSGPQSLGEIISAVLPNVLVIAGIILLFLLILGGLGFIVNAGKENPEGIAKAQRTIMMALIGFIIIFASYWVIQIVETITGLSILGN